MLSQALKSLLRPDKRVVVLTGAGISAESGVPTFRGKDGLWKKFKPEELATFDAFISNPQLVWEWYTTGGSFYSQEYSDVTFSPFTEYYTTTGTPVVGGIISNPTTVSPVSQMRRNRCPGLL